MNTRKGISPILATVIIIAVTLVIAIGVIGWIMGIWGGFGSTESLQIYPDSYINITGKEAYIHIKNTGSASAVIYKVEIVGVETITGTNSINPNTLSAGEDTTITVSIVSTGSYTSGATYQVKIYTSAGNVFSAVLRAD